MNIISLNSFLFLSIFLLMWKVMSKTKNKNIFLSISSIVAFFVISPYSLLYLSIWSVLIYSVSHLSNRKVSLYIGSFLGISSIFFWKFWDLVNYSVYDNIPSWVMPIGLSAFTFQGLSFLYEKKKKNIEDWNFLQVFTFCSFLPTVFSGPIQNAKNWSDEYFKNHQSTHAEIAKGSAFILIGVFYKLVISTSFYFYTDPIFKSPNNYDSASLILAMYCYAFELFHDFCGWSLIAEGVCLIMGIPLISNFNQPYKALNIHDFWSRWHISLSHWFKQYFYIDFLGGNRHGEIRKHINLFLTMMFSGVWHGINTGYLFWGLMHSLGIMVFHTTKKLKFTLNKYLAQILTFHFVCFAWIFFKSKSFSSGRDYVNNIFELTTSNHFFNHLFFIPLIGFCVVWHSYEKAILDKITGVFMMVEKQPLRFFCILFVLISIISILAPAGTPPFIYFGF